MEREKNQYCRFCGAELTHTFVDLGMSPLSNSYIPLNCADKGQMTYPLKVHVCDQCFLVQLGEFESPADIFGCYAYLSSYSTSWLKHVNERGFFARTFCAKEFANHGLCSRFVQCNISYNKKRGTLRGMHYQMDPFGEVKVVSCIAGAIYDVVLDMREDSPTFGEWISLELTEENRKMLYVPTGLAHGFQSLLDGTVVYYQMGSFYEPSAARTIGWNDSRYSIKWPLKEMIMSDVDRNCGEHR